MDIEVDADKTIRAFNAMPDAVQVAMRAATTKVGMVATAEMKRQIRGGHKAGTPTPSLPNTPPTNVTGNLRRQIRPIVRKGFSGYSVMVGSFAVYARQLELGGGRWKPGIKYPFVEPTARIMLQGNRAGNIYANALRKALSQ